jgi:alkylation response protein AidB-like acyl-CoA dehydrogenase
MDFSLAEVALELQPFQDEVRAWLKDAMRGSEHLRWSANWSTRENEEEYRFRRSLAEKLGERGWLFPTLPPELGGAGLSADHQTIIDAELSTYGLALDHVFYTLARIVVPCILYHGTEEQKRELIPPMAKGLVSVWQVLTEPQSGSDVANVKTTATRDGDHYVVNGQKIMVGHKLPPDWMWTLVCTDPSRPRHENLGWLYIDAKLPGITIQHLPMLMGIKNAVFFDGVRVPVKYLVGGENNGWEVSSTHMELEHGGGGSVTGDPAIDRLLIYCRETKRAGQPLIADPHVREILAEAFIESHAVRLMNQRNYWHRLQRKPHPYGGPQIRYYQRTVRLRNAQRVQQILGYEAMVPNLEVNEFSDFEYLMRGGPGMLHGGGTLDTDRLIVARRMGLGRATKEQAAITI